ncbi:hypothetical protein SODG_001952 [Sodalis praecaptivus]
MRKTLFAAAVGDGISLMLLSCLGVTDVIVARCLGVGEVTHYSPWALDIARIAHADTFSVFIQPPHINASQFLQRGVGIGIT